MPALPSTLMKRTCYITCPAYALHNPVDRFKVRDNAAWFAKEFALEVVTSPLLDRHLGHGAWLPAEDRIADFATALEHDVIWACRGGYGSVHLIDTVLKSRTRKRPILIGYSDLTILHACWHVRGWKHGLYGSIPNRLHDTRAGDSLMTLARGEGMLRSHHSDAGARVLRAGRARGPLYPACLSVLAGLCGTPAQPDLDGCVLAIEDIDVHPFLIDYHLSQLHLAGALDQVVGLVGGSFTIDERLDYLGPSVDEILLGWAERLRIPALSRLPYGHQDDALVLPYGRSTTLETKADQRWKLTIAPEKTPLARTMRSPK